MKKNILFLFFVLIRANLFAQSITINPSSQNVIDAKGTNANPKGILVPRMTTTERLGSGTGWADGSLVYDTDTKNFWYFNGLTLSWVKMAAGNVGLDLPYSGSGNSGIGSLFQIDNNAESGGYAIFATTKYLGNSNVALVGLDQGLYGVGVEGISHYGTGIRGRTTYGGLGGLFEGGVKVYHDRQTYDVPELELLRGVMTNSNPGSNIRTARLTMGKYTSGGFNNRWIFDAKVEGSQSQPTDRFKLQYSTNSQAVNSGSPVYSQNDILIFRPSGEVGIGLDPTEKLDINGNIKFNGKVSANNSFGNDGEVLTSRGSSLPAEWKSTSSRQYNLFTINNLTSDTFEANNIDALTGSFMLTKQSKVTINLFGSFKKYSSCSFNCGTEVLKLASCIGTSQFSCTSGQEIHISQLFTEPENLNMNLQLTGNASKTFVLAAGTYYFKTDFSITGTSFNSTWQLDGTSNSPTQMTIQILEN